MVFGTGRPAGITHSLSSGQGLWMGLRCFVAKGRPHVVTAEHPVLEAVRCSVLRPTQRPADCSPPGPLSVGFSRQE